MKDLTMDDGIAYYEICEEMLAESKKDKEIPGIKISKKNTVSHTKIKQIFEDYKNIGKKTESALDVYAETYQILLKLQCEDSVLKEYKKLALDSNIDTLKEISKKYITKAKKQIKQWFKLIF